VLSATKKLVVVLLAIALFLSAAPPRDEKQLSVYSPVATYTLPVLDRAGQEYVGLLELLEPLGRVTSESNGRLLKLTYNSTEAEFAAGQTRAKIRGHNFDFTYPFLIENSRGLVPLNSLNSLLPRFLGPQVNFRPSGRRLFVGEVGVQIGFRLDATTPPRLILNFTAAVNPTISTEPGKLRMVFRRDPVVSPGSQAIAFDNKVITQASYSESNGFAELDVDATDPLMASFSSDRKTITISIVPAASKPNVANQHAAPASPPSSGAPNMTVHRVIVVVDAAHGGDERGAALTDTLAEKDVTLGFARLLRHELETRGFAVNMLRDADITLTADQRAASANAGHAGLYLCLHAVSQGGGAHVYTALLPVEGPSKGVFHAWNAAQATALPVSRIAASAVAAKLQEKQFPVQVSSASLRPLNNVVIPAVAVELAPEENGDADLTSANYQQHVAAAIADGIASVRDRLAVQP
jgi:N-acetylmuramoyl-L-alanine amidase